ncbi:MAG: hypothetical protein IPN69_07550 [Acidobacteria bacterium]|nr:hypothetical protein [Acidobacteriota bacterium]MBK8147397.1 hypothetical protein [Acidobacteriota bacterium]MBK8810574.1 hypothetical protein [Acidobacteriota bacterium]
MSNSTTAATQPEKLDVLTGLFNDKETAERAYHSAISRGYTNDEVNLMMSDFTRKKYFSDDDPSEFGSKALEGAGAGSAIGGTMGAIVGAIAAIGTTVLLPGFGLVVAGPIVAALAGAGAGGLTGGLVGALVGWGIPEDRAIAYEAGLKDGKIIVGLMPRSRDDVVFFENEWHTVKHNEVS